MSPNPSGRREKLPCILAPESKTLKGPCASGGDGPAHHLSDLEEIYKGLTSGRQLACGLSQREGSSVPLPTWWHPHADQDTGVHRFISK